MDVTAQDDIDTQDCEHGLSAALCAGPNHYPADTDEHYSTAELTSLTAAQYHARGEGCPWDCSRCPGNREEDYSYPVADLFVGDEKVGTAWADGYTAPIDAIRLEARNAATSLGLTVRVVRL